MKSLVLIPLFLLSFFSLSAQPPAAYYESAADLNGTALRSALHLIIKDHTSLGYSALWSAYYTTDKRPDNGKVWDIYSDKPGSTPPYYFTFGTDQCGSYDSENDCYNREHTWPQSYFDSEEPMKSDLFQVYPTDGWVNNKRSNYAYGEVISPTWTSLNGSKLGPNSFPGYSGIVFEPIDSFKGDLARTYFYMATRYFGEDGSWSSWAMANKAELKPWAVAMLLEWHHKDPVSEKERNRNNEVYAKQHNRNPFIDQPDYADCIWGTGDCSGASTSVTGVQKIRYRIYPNPAQGYITIEWNSSDAAALASVEIKNLQGQTVFFMKAKNAKSIPLDVSGWARGIYLVKFNGTEGRTVQKLMVE